MWDRFSAWLEGPIPMVSCLSQRFRIRLTRLDWAMTRCWTSLSECSMSMQLVFFLSFLSASKHIIYSLIFFPMPPLHTQHILSAFAMYPHAQLHLLSNRSQGHSMWRISFLFHILCSQASTHKIIIITHSYIHTTSQRQMTTPIRLLISSHKKHHHHKKQITFTQSLMRINN